MSCSWHFDGGIIAQELAINYPELIQSLSLLVVGQNAILTQLVFDVLKMWKSC